MFAPDIESSTREERLAYVQDRWQCFCSCELCGRCSILKGRDAEIVYEEYIEGRKTYREITLALRDYNY
jgi:hypothetical protein